MASMPCMTVNRTPFLYAVACRQTTFSAVCPKRWRRRSLRTGEEYTEENAVFKAQCVSYILGKEFGVDVSGYAFEAPADFLRTDDPQTIRAELTDIRDAAYNISARMMRSLEQSKAPRQSEQER